MKTFREKPLGKGSAKETFREGFIKAQSAMEYLMTYGWAILIVAVVLGALYSLGVFNGAAFLGTSCIAASGFYCTNPTLSTGGVLTVTIGQATGTTFNNTYLYFVPSGTNFSTLDPSTSIGTLNSGQQVTVNIPLPVGSPYPAAYTLGTPLSGYLYLQFTDIYGTTEVNKIATVLTKVTATSSGGTPIPSGIVAYVPIILSNSQSSATPSPFQQMIQINEGNYANYIAYNGKIANFEFFTQSGQILPAWIESNNSDTLTVWVKLPNGIPASSSLAIYLGFASKSTNLLSSSGTSGIGEAPQLSSTYAEYDDGASVFNFYDNFAGTTLNSHWSVVQSSATTNINNGLTVEITSGSTGYYIIYSTATLTPPFIAEDLFSTTAFAINIRTYNPTLSASNTQTNPAADASSSNVIDWSINSANSGYWNAQQGDSSAYFASSTGNNGAASNWLLGIGYTGSTNYWYGFNGATQTNYYTYTSSSTDTPTGSLYLGLGANWASVSTNINIKYTWVRVRAYPPNGVMPSVSFGGLSSA